MDASNPIDPDFERSSEKDLLGDVLSLTAHPQAKTEHHALEPVNQIAHPGLIAVQAAFDQHGILFDHSVIHTCCAS